MVSKMGVFWGMHACCVSYAYPVRMVCSFVACWLVDGVRLLTDSIIMRV